MQRNAQLATGALGIAVRARREKLYVGAGRDHANNVSLGIIMFGQVAGFLLGIDHQQVRVIHQLLFADAAGFGLQGVIRRPRGVFHRGEGMRCVNERDTPEIPQQPPHLARKPVVGVDEVIFFTLPFGKLHHAAGEGGQLGREILFV